MKSRNLAGVLISIIFLMLLADCEKREINNPFDEECPKEIYTPTNLKAELQSESIKLSWQQPNLNISGFIVNRSEGESPYSEEARLDKAATGWEDPNVTPGIKYIYQILAYAGDNQSNMVTIEITPVFLAIVSTSSVSSITPTSVLLGGNVTNDGGAAVTERGVCYGTNQNPAITDNKVVSGSGKGVFSTTLTGLTSQTTYYARAFATNSKGTAYGSQVTFTTSTQTANLPTVTTTGESGVTMTSAILGGNVTQDGGAPVTERGVCYGKVQNPTIADTKIVMGSGTGVFSNTVTGLTAGTTYYVRAYAINSQGASYGTQITITTPQSLTMATVATSNETLVTQTSAVLGGNVSNDGGASVTERGICYAITENPTTSNTKIVMGNGTGTFSNTISGLVAGTKYYVRAYAINSQGTAYGSQISFTTTSQTVILASLTTAAATNVTANSANVGGNITDEGGGTISERGIVYSNNYTTPTTSHTKVIVGSGPGIFSTTLTGLSMNTTYYVRAYAINGAGTAYGPAINFITSGNTPTVSTKDVTNVLETTVVAGGIVLSDQGVTVSERGVCYGTSLDPTIYDVKIASGSGLGGFNVPINILTPNTTYYVRAYATNKNGTGYGENKTFKTADAYYAGFENGIPAGWSGMWTTSTDAPFEGFFCLKSSNPGDSIVVSRTIATSVGGQVTFYHKSGAGFDSVNTEFYIDNKLQTTLKDEGWTLKAFNITAGTHKFKWVNKGGGYSNNITYIDYFICPK